MRKIDHELNVINQHKRTNIITGIQQGQDIDKPIAKHKLLIWNFYF